MPVQEVSIPKQARERKYVYDADALDVAVSMLNDGKAPGDGPFDSDGKARSAANALIEALGEDGSDLGTRVFEVPEKGSGAWYFGLHPGRRSHTTNGDAPQADADTAPEPKPKGKGK